MANPNPSPETRFGPGCPPGPGRPRSKPITDRLRERLADPALIDELIDRWIAMVRDGDVRALKELLLRLEGRPDGPEKSDLPLTVADAIRALDQVERALGVSPPTEE
jgi:hypothetical protein